MSKTTGCDACGASTPYERPPDWTVLEARSDVRMISEPPIDFDLCPACAKRIRRAIEAEVAAIKAEAADD